MTKHLAFHASREGGSPPLQALCAIFRKMTKAQLSIKWTKGTREEFCPPTHNCHVPHKPEMPHMAHKSEVKIVQGLDCPLGLMWNGKEGFPHHTHTTLTVDSLVTRNGPRNKNQTNQRSPDDSPFICQQVFLDSLYQDNSFSAFPTPLFFKGSLFSEHLPCRVSAFCSTQHQANFRLSA